MTSVSSYALATAPRLAVTQAQAGLSRAQAELSSGHLADIGLGLGAGTGTYVSLSVQAGRLSAIKDANAAVTTKLGATSTALDALRGAATSFLSSLTAASTAGAVPGVLVSTAGANLDALTGTLNTSIGGDAIFAGIDTARPPMTPYGAGSAAKAKVDNSFEAAFGVPQGSAAAGSIGGADMANYLAGSFADQFSAQGYAGTWSSASDTPTSAQISPSETVDTSVSANAEPFRQLAQAYTMVKEFGGSNFGSAAGQAVMAAASKLVAAAVSGLTGAEADVGAAQNAVTGADTRMEAQVTYLTARSTGMVGVDPATLSTQISGLQTQIQASYEITSQLQQLSLVNYLK